MSAAPDAPAQPIRDAATIVLVRADKNREPRVLMGQRGAGAAFMPSKFVFPGGAVDAGDRLITVQHPLDGRLRETLAALPVTPDPPTPEAVALAAIRELWEEAGLMLARQGPWSGPLPDDWAAFAQAGVRPAPECLRFLFRAVTPPGRSRRFDARFFLANAADLDGDPDDFSAATDELSHLHWISMTEARNLDLPFITEVVLAEAEAILRGANVPSVPFFDNSGPESTFRRIG